MRVSKWLIIIVFAVATILGLDDSLRPVDGGSWRESDMASIARNFANEGMDPRLPRIDWRGDGPGYVEMEFPFTSWLTALAYKVFGQHDVFGRLWSLIFSVATLLLFLKLARRYLGDIGSVAAFSFFAFNPLVIQASTAFQPEAFMLLAYIGAVHFFLRWHQNDSNRDLAFAAVMTALALLAKATAGHIGLMFGVLLIQKYGVRVFFRPKIWLFAAAALLPAGLWYIHAKDLWLTFGNSLGVSNEYHWIGWDFFTNPYFATGILRTEIVDVWVVFGLASLVFVLVIGRRETIVKWSLVWMGSVFVMYIIAARTTADDWASYYHIFSVPPAALLFGVGLDLIRKQTIIWADTFSHHGLYSNLIRITAIVLVTATFGATLAVEAGRTRATLREHRMKDSEFQFARSISPLLDRRGLILVSGGQCFDDGGYPVAFNKSYMFYALERKGRNICVEEQTVDNVAEYAKRGYVYFVAQRMEMDKSHGFSDALEALFQVVASNDDYIVFALSSDKANEMPL